MTTLLWYDYETFGISPKIDRPSQFAAIRTDVDFNPIGDPIVLYCQPANDFLPNPEACLITGITPQLALEKGVKEVDFFRAINELMSEPGTVSVGFNSINFDSEVSRYGFYRNFINPYNHEWKNDCSRWDILDVMRAAAVYSGSDIVWPKNSEDKPSFKLTDLTAANGISHESAHDALDDVRATIALAKLLKDKRPKFYEFLFNSRTKKEVAKHLSIGKPVMHVSRSYGSDRHYTTQVLPIANHPTNKNAIISIDLGSASFSRFLHEEAMTASDIKVRLYAKSDLLKEQGVERPPLVSIQVNKCPALIPLPAFTDKVAELFSIDKAQLKENHDELIDFQKEHPEKYSALLVKIQQSFNEPAEPEDDPDLMLYSGFLGDNDQRISAKVHNTLPSELNKLSKSFVSAPHMPDLLFRFRARNHLETLSSDELERWNNYRFERIATYSNDYTKQLNSALEKRINDASLSQEEKDKANQVISALRQHAIATFSPKLLNALNDSELGFSEAIEYALGFASDQSLMNNHEDALHDTNPSNTQQENKESNVERFETNDDQDKSLSVEQSSNPSESIEESHETDSPVEANDTGSLEQLTTSTSNTDDSEKNTQANDFSPIDISIRTGSRLEFILGHRGNRATHHIYLIQGDTEFYIDYSHIEAYMDGLIQGKQEMMQSIEDACTIRIFSSQELMVDIKNQLITLEQGSAELPTHYTIDYKDINLHINALRVAHDKLSPLMMQENLSLPSTSMVEAGHNTELKKTDPKMITLVDADCNTRYQLLYVNHHLISFKAAPHTKKQQSLSDYATRLADILYYRRSSIDLNQAGMISAEQSYTPNDIRGLSDRAVAEAINKAAPSQNNIFGNRIAFITGQSHAGPVKATVLNNHILFDEREKANPEKTLMMTQVEQSVDKLIAALDIPRVEIHLDLPDKSALNLIQQAWDNFDEAVKRMDVENEDELSFSVG